jgi:DNA polymerase-3 subunit delta
VKIAPKDIEQFIINIPKDIKAILLYGPDAGLIGIRAGIIEKSRNLVDKFKYEQIKNNPSQLLDKLHAIKLFGENLAKEKIALIECNGTSLVEPLLSIVKSGSYKGMLLFCASELGTDSSLRKTFESNQNLAAIPCYLDDQIGISRVIQQILKDRSITCGSGVMQILSTCVPFGDRALVINEIEKILLFLGGKKHILEVDLKDYLQTQGEVSFDKLCYQLSLREVDNTESLLIKLQNEGHNLVSIIRMIIYHFNRLYQVKYLIEQGKDPQQALSSLSPPLFFKQVNDFTRSLKLWKLDQLMQMLMQLSQLELSAKQTSMPANLMLKQMIASLIIKY